MFSLSKLNNFPLFVLQKVIDFVDYTHSLTATQFLIHQKLCNVIHKPGNENLLVELTIKVK